MAKSMPLLINHPNWNASNLTIKENFTNLGFLPSRTTMTSNLNQNICIGHIEWIISYFWNENRSYFWIVFEILNNLHSFLLTSWTIDIRSSQCSSIMLKKLSGYKLNIFAITSSANTLSLNTITLSFLFSWYRTRYWKNIYWCNKNEVIFTSQARNLFGFITYIKILFLDLQFRYSR